MTQTVKYLRARERKRRGIFQPLTSTKARTIYLSFYTNIQNITIWQNFDLKNDLCESIYKQISNSNATYLNVRSPLVQAVSVGRAHQNIPTKFSFILRNAPYFMSCYIFSFFYRMRKLSKYTHYWNSIRFMSSMTLDFDLLFDN